MSILINNWNGSGLIQSAVIAAAVSFGIKLLYIAIIIVLDSEIGTGSLVPQLMHFHIRSDVPKACNHEN